MDWDNLVADVNCILTKHFTEGRSGKSIDKVVVHHNAGNLTVEGCYSVWQSREASAHYQVETSGRIGQLVWDSDTAWACGNWDANCTSISVEHANDSTTNWTISDACLDAGAHLVAAICKYYGLGRPEWLVNVFPHSYFSATSCPGQIYGTQKDEYMTRCQSWYDEMTGTTSGSSSSSSSSGSSGLPDGAKDFAQNPLLCDGYFGPLTTKYVQIALRNHGYYPAGSYVIDGVWGYYSKLEMQKYLRSLGYYPASQYLLDGDFGEASTKALQQHLHDIGTYWDEYGWCLIDGDWGDQTTSAIQRAINGGIL